MRHLLFGVQSWDPPTLGAAAAALIVSALLASYIPTRRAASVNPIEVLRAVGVLPPVRELPLAAVTFDDSPP